MRVTFATIPAFGHLLPVLPLAAAFAAAGHEVEVGADRSFARLLPVPFFQVVPEGMTLREAEQEAKAEIVDRTDPMGFARAMFGVVMPRHMAPRLLTRWAELGPPDLVVHESSAVGAAVAARDAGVPCVAYQVFLTPYASFAELLRPVVDRPPDLLVDPRPDTWRGAEGDPVERMPVRAVAWSDPRGVRPDWLGTRSTGPTAYLTLGTVSFGAVEALRRSILETAEHCARVLVAAGPEADVAALGALPEHVSVERFVDQPAVLAQVDVAVHHGGSGTVLGCLAAGVPQVVTPQGADQFSNADRLRNLDLGCAVGTDDGPGSVGAAVERVLSDEALGRRVRQVRDEIAAMPSPAQVVETLSERHMQQM